LDTGVLYCDENLTRLASFPAESVDLIYLDPPFFSNRVYEVIWGDEAEVRSFEDRWEGGIQHYIGWMRERVEQMHRVLKPTGSLYLHCDPHASHYLKIMLDEIFGAGMFQSEVVWKRTSSHNSAKRWGPIHDTIFFYGKSSECTWNPVFLPLPEETAEAWYNNVEADTGPDDRRIRSTRSEALR
jgi:DNA modification methylase